MEPSKGVTVGKIEQVPVPDIGDFDEVEVVEVLVSSGDKVQVDDSLITLESDKASMEIPAPAAGVIQELRVSPGDKIGQGAIILTLEVEAQEVEAGKEAKETAPPASPEPSPAAAPPAAPPVATPVATSAATPAAPSTTSSSTAPSAPPARIDEAGFAKAHASPAVRRFARELGVDLVAVTGSGRAGRVLREDVQAFVKKAMQGKAAEGAGGFSLPPAPEVDFSRFGEVETKALSRIRKISARHLSRAWVTIPHVTQFDQADITEMEAFRKANKATAADRGVKLTPVSFLLKACAQALLDFPEFNSSLSADGESLILKKFVNIGVAVDTPNGLVVPVIRDVDRKSLLELSADLGDVSSRARDGKLMPKDLQGGCFSISSLGGIGGTAFTPIVNAPEVAILGVSRSAMKPIYQDGEFVPRLMLPLSLSYDHRVIDGASAARFTTHLASLLSDIRKLLL
ncbi:MAG: dihydrolipoyllysine-residue acetyltransferase [Deltaproteobacteria bacterium]|nr:dihydrolipoyllysine-residue acetyltransferase [Deltaproteobacteria bacterium]